MKPGGPWSVKGIEPQTREVAKNAARRSGMTLGEWLNSVISDQADGTVEKTNVVGTMTASAGSSSIDSFERATTRLEDIAQQLARIARQETDASSAYSYGAPPSRPDNDGIVRLLNRVESNERQQVEAFSAVNDRLSVLSRQFSQATKAATARPDESQGFQTLEKAVRNIVEHMEASEKRNRDNFRSLQDRLADMSSKASNATSDQVLRQAPAFSQLENRLGELARRVEATETVATRGLPDTVRQELHGLAGRIDTVREAAEQFASRAQTQAVQASQQELRTIENRILGLLNEAQSTFRSGSGNPDELQRLQGDIAQLNSRIDEARKGLASDHDVRALRQAVEQLSTRVQQGADNRPLVEMDRRIVELAQRLHDQQHYVQQVPQMSELEQRFGDLEQRLTDALQSPANSHAQVALQQQIAHVSERMDRTEKQISHFETIERAITQLYEGLEQTRNATKQVAEDAASRVAQQFAGQFAALPQQNFTLAGAPEIAALEQGLQVLRESTQGADQRNQETLFAVHETLEHIVSKLSELETAAIGQRVAAAVSAPQSFAAEVRAQVESAQDDTPAEHNMIEQSYVPVAPEFVADPALDTPVQQEPYLEMPGVASANPQEFRSMAGAAPASVAFETKSDGTADLIAAARRAAQVSRDSKSVLNSLSPSAAKLSETGSRKLLSRFKLPFLNRSAKPKSRPLLAGDAPKAMPEIKPAKSTNEAAKRRTLMLGGLVVLAGAAALLLNFDSKPTLPMAPTEATPAPAVPEATVAPADKQSSVMPSPDVSVPDAGPDVGPDDGTDSILTGSVEAPVADKVADAVSGEAPADALAMLPAEVGTQKLKLAAAAGDTNAQFIIATRFMDGKSVTQDREQAAYWFGKAAAGGLAPAQYRIATMYERGQGVAKDVKAALGWYERAAALGNVRSMHNAAVIAANNEAGPADYARAFKWFSLASSHGLKDSQFNLAVLLERGLGTKADLAEAAFWYAAAGLQNDQDAQRRADLLSATLPAAEVDGVKQRLKSWKAQVAPKEANIFEIDEAKYGDKQATLSKPVNGNEIEVSRVQDMLTQLGYNVGGINGQLSVRTSNAIKLFQIEQGLVADGHVTPDLIGAMEVLLG